MFLHAYFDLIRECQLYVYKQSIFLESFRDDWKAGIARIAKQEQDAQCIAALNQLSGSGRARVTLNDLQLLVTISLTPSWARACLACSLNESCPQRPSCI